MTPTNPCFEPQELYCEGCFVSVTLVALSTGETIEGKREQFLAQGYSIAHLDLIETFITQNPELGQKGDFIIADASVEPIIPEGNQTLCWVPVHGACKGCQGGHFRNGLIDYRVPKHASDPTLVCILVVRV